MRVVRFGDNMRDVAVTEGDKVEAQRRFGVSVNTLGVNDLVDVVEGVDGWHTAGSAAFIDLGPLKGNLGDQVYEIPADADLGTVRSVTIWCVRFSVSFGAAQLTAG